MPLPNLVVRAAATVYRGTTVYCLARIKAKDASHNMVNLTPADVSEINWRVENKATGVEVDSGTLTPADVILPAISNATIWTVDNRGFNFIAEFEYSLFEDESIDNYNVNIEFIIGIGATAKKAKGQWGVNIREANTTPTP